MDENYFVKKIAMILHEFWKDEKLADGFHLPEKCPIFEKNSDNQDVLNSSDIIHCNKCDFQLKEFCELENYVRENYLQKAKIYFDKFISNDNNS